MEGMVPRKEEEEGSRFRKKISSAIDFASDVIDRITEGDKEDINGKLVETSMQVETNGGTSRGKRFLNKLESVINGNPSNGVLLENPSSCFFTSHGLVITSPHMTSVGGSEAIPANNVHVPFNGLFAAPDTPSDFLTAGGETQYTTVGYSFSQSSTTASEEHWEAKKQTDTTTKTQCTTANYSVSQSNNPTSEEKLETKPKHTVDFQTILSYFFRHQDEETVKNEISDEEEYKLFKLLRDRTKEVVNINRLEEEEIELEFERAVENLDQHRVHCPNCNSSITKVVLRKRRRVNTPIPSPPERDNWLFGCFSCFSIFIPRGNCLNLFGCLGKKASEVDSLRTTLLPGNSSPNHRDEQQGGSFDVFQIFHKEGPQLKVENRNTVINREDNQRQPPQEQVPTPDTSQNPYEASPEHIGIDIPPVSGGSLPTKPRDEIQEIPTIKDEVSEGGSLPAEPIDEIQEIPIIREPVSKGGSLLTEPRDEIQEIPTIRDTVSKGGSLSTKPRNEIQEIPSIKDTVSEGSKKVEILKSIVYGGLMESITSLSIVSSAAAADAKTVNIVAMGLANLIGGLFVLGPNLRELKNDDSGQERYKELLGQRQNFSLHATVVVLSFLLFGLIPPVTYGFSFRQSNDMDLKLLVAAAASLLCIAILAIGKAYIQKQPKFLTYIKTVLYYITLAVMGSGISYALGDLIKRLVQQLGWFDSSAAVSLSLPQVGSVNPAWESY